MINAGADFAAAVSQSSRRFRAHLYDGNTEVNGIVKSAKIHLGSTGPDKFYIGAVYSAYAEIVLDERNTTLEGKELRLDVGVLTDAANNVYTDITLGYFTALAPAATRYRTTFTAIGRIAAKLANESISFTDTKTLAQVAAMITTATGVTITFAAGIDTTNTIDNAFDGTCRDALTMLATAAGGYATETNTGGILVSRYSDASTASYGPDTMQTLPEMAEYDFEITGVQAITPTGTYQDGNTINVVIEDNYITSDLFDDFSGGLIGFSYRPGTVHLALGDPRIEPTDVLTITTPYSESYIVPCMAVTHIFDGGFQTEIKTPAVQAVGEIVGAMSAAVKEATKNAEDAKKVAYNYLSRDATGVMVADMSGGTAYTPSTVPSGVKNAFIDSDSFDIRDGVQVLATFGVETAIYTTDGTELAHFGYASGAAQSGTAIRPYYTLGMRKAGETIGNYSLAAGYTITASAAYSTAMGNSSAATGWSSFAAGEHASASDNAAVSMGCYTAASGPYSIAMGRSAEASMIYSIAMGYGADASANSAIAIGNHAAASGLHAVAFGYYAAAEGDYSIAMGREAEAGADSSVAIGYNAGANGVNALAVGYNAEAIGDHAAAIGCWTSASGDYATAIGQATKASSPAQFVHGKYNAEDTNDQFAEIVGGGWGEYYRCDVYELTWDGDARYMVDTAALAGVDKDLCDAITALGWTNDVFEAGTISGLDMLSLKKTLVKVLQKLATV